MLIKYLVQKLVNFIFFVGVDKKKETKENYVLRTDKENQYRNLSATIPDFF